MATIAVLAPMQTELAPVAKRLGLRKDKERRGSLATSSGWFEGHELVAAMAGVGTRRSADVTRRLIEAVRPDHGVVVGVAGGLSPDLAVGDLVIPREVRNLDDGACSRAHPLGDVEPQGVLVTSRHLHGWDSLRAHAESGVLAVDMETAAIAEVCDDAGVPWTAFRALSDVVRDGTIDESALDLVREDGSTNIGGALRLLARHPGKARSLAVMGRDATKATAAASAAVESALRATPA